MSSLLFSKFKTKPSVGTGTDSDTHKHKSQASSTDTQNRQITGRPATTNYSKKVQGG